MAARKSITRQAVIKVPRIESLASRRGRVVEQLGSDLRSITRAARAAAGAKRWQKLNSTRKRGGDEAAAAVCIIESSGERIGECGGKKVRGRACCVCVSRSSASACHTANIDTSCFLYMGPMFACHRSPRARQPAKCGGRIQRGAKGVGSSLLRRIPLSLSFFLIKAVWGPL